MKLLLHCCCAPCSIQCVSALRTEGIEPQLFWYNPNIHPYTEYSARRDCLAEFAANEKLNLTMPDDEEYGLRFFLQEVSAPVKENDKNARCGLCYKLRLEKAAMTAAKDGYEAFTTTLLISPYQNHEAIKLAGQAMSVKYGVEFFYRDFRPLFREGQAAARAAGFYMQKYCGCIYSEEAPSERTVQPCR